MRLIAAIEMPYSVKTRKYKKCVFSKEIRATQ
jgi:hypothetical protein